MLVLLMSIVDDKEFRIDFGQGREGANWMVVNDGVMGGLSQGQGEVTGSSIIFKGRISLENDGGFASLRCPWGEYDLSEHSHVKLRYRSEGVGFAMVLENSPRWYEVNYKMSLPVATDWTIVTLPLNKFSAYQVGRKLSGTLGAQERKQVLRFGFISDEKRADYFRLEIDWIEFL